MLQWATSLHRGQVLWWRWSGRRGRSIQTQLSHSETTSHIVEVKIVLNCVQLVSVCFHEHKYVPRYLYIIIYFRDAQPTACRLDLAPECVIAGLQSRLKNKRNLSWTTEILWMNLSFIELLTLLQLITIRNSSDGNDIKPQARNS